MKSEAGETSTKGREASTGRRLAWFGAFYLLGLAAFTASTYLLRLLVAP